MKYKQQTISCPHCGHNQVVEVDYSAGDQDYYDDCQACCNPIHLRLHLDESRRTVSLHVDADDEQFY